MSSLTDLEETCRQLGTGFEALADTFTLTSSPAQSAVVLQAVGTQLGDFGRALERYVGEINTLLLATRDLDQLPDLDNLEDETEERNPE